MQKKLSMMLKERPNGFTNKLNQFVKDNNKFHVKEEYVPQLDSFDNSNGTNRLPDESTNSIDLMDISKCIMGIEEEKNGYDHFETIHLKCENSASDEYNIEAIKKYLIEQPTEYIDLNSLPSVKQDYFISF